jgi:hypothetical protein
VWLGESPTFRSNISPPYLGQKRKPSRKAAETSKPYLAHIWVYMCKREGNVILFNDELARM